MEGKTSSITKLAARFFGTVSSLCPIQFIRELLFLLSSTETLEQFFANHFLLLSHLYSICVHPDAKLGTLDRGGREEPIEMTEQNTAGKKIIRMQKKNLNTNQDDKTMQK